MNYLFFIGNKRSGTTHLVSSLNAHPNLFIAPEADLLWAIYRRAQRLPAAPYPDDGARGYEQTMAQYGHILARQDLDTLACLHNILTMMAEREGKNIPDIQIFGDKKPVQTADPAMFEFTRTTIPAAKFIHLIRHPAAVVQSMKDGLVKMPWAEMWRRDDAALMAFWVRHELWAIGHGEAHPDQVLRIRYQDLATTPDQVGADICRFLGVAETPAFMTAMRATRDRENHKYRNTGLVLSPQAQAIVRQFDLTL